MSEFNQKWIDPTLGYPDDTLVNGVVEHDHYYAVSGLGQHKVAKDYVIIHDNNMDKINGKDWELFRASCAGTIDGKEYVWGMMHLGLGLANMMFSVDQIRELTAGEKLKYENTSYGIYGSHSGEFSYSLPSLKFES